MHSNGATKRAFPPGIHGPSVTFFNDDDQQDIDWVTQERHLEYLITSGLQGGMSDSSVHRGDRMKLIE